MTERQENKFSMYVAVEQYCDDNDAIVSTIPALKTAHSGFKIKITAIRNTVQQQSVQTGGIAQDKNVLRVTLCDATLNIASAVMAFAKDKNNLQLFEECNYSRSELLKLKDSQITQICTSIKEKAEAHLGELNDYGITATELTEFQTVIDQYIQATPKPRGATAQKKTSTQNLKQLFAETDDILKTRMDKLVLKLKNTHPDFYHTYQNTRTIIDLGKSSGKNGETPNQ